MTSQTSDPSQPGAVPFCTTVSALRSIVECPGDAPVRYVPYRNEVVDRRRHRRFVNDFFVRLFDGRDYVRLVVESILAKRMPRVVDPATGRPLLRETESAAENSLYALFVMHARAYMGTDVRDLLKDYRAFVFCVLSFIARSHDARIIARRLVYRDRCDKFLADLRRKSELLMDSNVTLKNAYDGVARHVDTIVAEYDMDYYGLPEELVTSETFYANV